ncbi:hypothetical protein HDU87_001753 [Geranomyces variabilis]|uniref:Cytidyltransferase-like domain-containing protein n=1 Tax=Geranomyces variabilis TaxID=109894 RepID=A0AAD5TNS3_9FUNG|nr:hypothetical protein HDU87_001753 [Geranomyces variabilis]
MSNSRPKSFLLPIALDSLSSPLHRAIALVHEAVALLLLPCGPRPHPSNCLGLKIIVACPELAAGAADRWHEMQSVLAALYAAAGKAAHERDYPVLDVDVIFEEWCGYDPWLGDTEDGGVAVVGYAEDQAALALVNTRRAKDRLSHLHFIPVPEPDTSADSSSPATEGAPPASPTQPGHAYENVAMGGTFDHLHGGHKILLTAAVWLTRQRLVCGVMDLDPPRLAKKKGAKYIESLDTRIDAVKRFLNLIRREQLQYDIVPIADEYGPTRTDPNIQAIIGSLETKRGCEAVNTLRAENGLCALDVFTIDVISSSSAKVQPSAMEDKISSTAIRQYLERLDAS